MLRVTQPALMAKVRDIVSHTTAHQSTTQPIIVFRTHRLCREL